MSIPYTKFQWFYPPRSDVRIPYKRSSPVLQMWKEFKDAYAQYKMNGSNCMLVVYPDQRIECWKRVKIGPEGKASPDGEPQQLDWNMPSALRDEILSLTPKGVFTVYNVELMHQKTPKIKNTLYFFDVLVWHSQHLLDTSYRDRYKIIADVLGKRFFPLDLEKADGKLYIADNMPPTEWDTAWQSAKTADYCEGLVLKRHGDISRLQFGDTEVNNSGFICRIRKPHKNSRY